MLVGYLYVFGKMSISVFYPFLNWVISHIIWILVPSYIYIIYIYLKKYWCLLLLYFCQFIPLDKYLLYIFWCFDVATCVFIIVFYLPVDILTLLLLYDFFISTESFWLKKIFLWYSKPSFGYHLHEVSFYSPSLSAYVSLNLKWISFRQETSGPCFKFIQPC